MQARGIFVCACALVVAMALTACGKKDDAAQGGQATPATAAAPKAAAYAPPKFDPEAECRKGILRLTQSVAEFNTTGTPAKILLAEQTRDGAEARAKDAKWDDCFKALDDGFAVVNVDGGYVKAAKAGTPR